MTPLLLCNTSNVSSPRYFEASPREMRAQIIRPQNDGEHPSPEIQVQEPNRKEPGRAPHSERERVLLNLYFDFLSARSRFGCHILPLKPPPFYACRKAGLYSTSGRSAAMLEDKPPRHCGMPSSQIRIASLGLAPGAQKSGELEFHKCLSSRIRLLVIRVCPELDVYGMTGRRHSRNSGP